MRSPRVDGLSRRAALGVIAGAAAHARASGGLPEGRPLVVATAAGRVRGAAVGGIAYFKGVPYGSPVGGAARFLPPRAARPWAGVRDALAFGQRSPQPAGPPGTMPAAGQPMGEDCLVLNLWTPRPDGRRRPVMVWLHPGGFGLGAGSDYTGEGTLSRKEDVVLVEVNHRLGLFGFLDLSAYDRRFATSGAAGMLDIVLALRWVRDNIEAFGGDPDRVTIFGQSGGGAKVSALMAMPAAQGLFHRAIAQSGFYVRGVEPAVAQAVTRQVFALCGVREGDVAALQALPVPRLLDAFSSISTAAGRRRRVFAPVVGNAALPHHPFDPVAPAISADVPLIAGVTRDESTILLGLLSARPERMFALDEAGMRQELSAFLAADAGAVDRLVTLYRARRPSATPSDIFFAVTTDEMLRLPSTIEAGRKAALARAPAWLYLFAWDRSPRFGGRMGAHHGAELPFVFDTIDNPGNKAGHTPQHRILADQMRAAWAQFARAGDPNHAGLPTWRRYDSIGRETMIFDMPSRPERDPGGAELRAVATLAG